MEAGYTPTKWDAEHGVVGAKEKFARHFLKFVESGYKKTLFYDWFYVRLSMCFGFIAHYNRDGFYETYFTNPNYRVRFLDCIMRYPCYGQKEYTYCDVERRIQEWVKETGQVEKAMRELHSEKTVRELAVRNELLRKYPLSMFPVEVPNGHRDG